MSELQKALESGTFAVTAEMAPPKGYDFSEQLAAAAPQSTTFWGRVAQMFRDFWSAITHIFH